MTRYEIGPEEMLAPGERLLTEVNGREMGIFNVKGDYYVLPNICPHQLGPLCESEAKGTTIADDSTAFKPRYSYDGEIVACPWHELEFHIPTGECLAIPEFSVRSRKVVVEDGTLYVEM